MMNNEYFSQLFNRGKKAVTWYCKSVLRDVGVNIKSFSRKPYYVVQPGNISPMNSVPGHIVLPPYCASNVKESNYEIKIKAEEEIQIMRQSCALAKKMLDAARSFVRVGVTTDELDQYIHNLIVSHSAYPSSLNYCGFPKSLCTSVNNVVCHGIPDDRELRNGDIITVDITVYYKGFHGDCAATFLIGDVDERGKQLVNVAKKALEKGISVCRPGQSFNKIGFVIGSEVGRHGFSVIPTICGHGIGRDFHELPQIEHGFTRNFELLKECGTASFMNDPEDLIMEPGMTFTIEPAVGEDSDNVEILNDMWTVVTDDDSRTAQFEHTVLITDTGVEILTK